MSLVTVLEFEMQQGQWYCIITGDEIEEAIIKHNGFNGTEKSVGGYIQDIWRRKDKNKWQYVHGAPEKVKEDIVIQEYVPYKKLKVLGQKSGQVRLYAYQHNDLNPPIAEMNMFWS